MSERYPGGFITKAPVTPTTSAASGIWTLDQATQYIKAGTWPEQKTYFMGLLTPNTEGYGVSVDNSGNFYLVGIISISAKGAMSLIKYDKKGNLSLQKDIGNRGFYSNVYGYDNITDSVGNIYICGNPQTGSGAYDNPCISKLNSAGASQWNYMYTVSGTNTIGYARAIDIDTGGNLYVGGYTYSNSQAANAALAMKTDSSGSILWQKEYITGSEAQGYGAAVDSSGNMYVCGYGVPSGQLRALVFKYDTSGTYQWGRNLGDATDTEETRALGVAVDTSNNVYICGYTSKDSSGAQDILIAKYNSSGTLQWQRLLGNNLANLGYAIAVDSSGSCYVCGTQGTTSTNAIIAKYDTSGAIQWQRSLGSSATLYLRAISVDSNGSFYLCGSFLGGGSSNFFAKLPTDGSLTGSYSLGGYTFTYAASSATDASGTLTSSTASASVSNPGRAPINPSFTTTTSTLTSSVTQI
jgi:hypothetical protein